MIQDKLVDAETVRVQYESFGEFIPGLALIIVLGLNLSASIGKADDTVTPAM